jgi:DNA mismatch endonuclease (patch repair protein)
MRTSARATAGVGALPTIAYPGSVMRRDHARAKARLKGDGTRPSGPLSRSEIMSRVGQRDTGPEMRLRRLLWASGLRYRVNHRVEGVRVDIAFPGRRLAVFVDGCFWHCCPVHCSAPKNNASYWTNKLRENRARDERQTLALLDAGWAVIRLWEHEATTAFVEGIARIRRAHEGTTR